MQLEEKEAKACANTWGGGKNYAGTVRNVGRGLCTEPRGKCVEAGSRAGWQWPGGGLEGLEGGVRSHRI